MPRLFIGIPLPESYHEKSRTLAHELRSRLRSRVSWTPRGNAHITLLFLGDVADEAIPAIKDALASMAIPPFQIRAGKCGVFPDTGRPRVLYAGVTKGAKPCATLAAAVARTMEPLGYSNDKPFHPHITVGRVKKAARDNWDKILMDVSTNWPGYKVDRFILWESTLTSEGAIYTPLEEFMLQGK